MTTCKKNIHKNRRVYVWGGHGGHLVNAGSAVKAYCVER